MKVKASNGLVRCLKAEGVPWVACYPTNHVNNALGEEGALQAELAHGDVALVLVQGVDQLERLG